MLVDKVSIQVKAGDGGAGLVSFRKEKFKPFGGPDGGDGGKGGDVYLAADNDVHDLSPFKHKKHYAAQDGKSGGSNKMHGADAGDLVIRVPLGTLAYAGKHGSDEFIGDLCKDGQIIRVAEGGKGGRGNVRFATATNKAPRNAQPGTPGEDVDISLRVRLPMDVAIIGPANSGKSELLSALSGAHPVIADYPFTTREPVLGTVYKNYKKFTWAEMPAVIDRAHEGKGLGNRHLDHVERARLLIYLIDISNDNRVDEMRSLLKEVEIFSKSLRGKKSILVLNKMDLVTDPDDFNKIKDQMEVFGLPVFLISAREKSGLDDLVEEAHRLVAGALQVEETGMPPQAVFRPRPVDEGRGR